MYGDQTLQDWIKQGNNVAIICGYGNLLVIDADTQEAVDIADNNLPATFTVKTGKGKHCKWNNEYPEKIKSL